MIRFVLACAAGHGFEGWFANSEAFETQKAGGALACPVCGAADVNKALMTPALSTSRKRDSVRVAAHAAQLPEENEVIAKVRQIRKQLTESADYVGDRFAEEARRIHYDEVEKRGIYGEATSDEVRALTDEGIEFHALPVLPEDHN